MDSEFIIIITRYSFNFTLITGLGNNTGNDNKVHLAFKTKRRQSKQFHFCNSTSLESENIIHAVDG